MPAVCPNCRQAVPTVGSPCAEVGCVRRGYHGIAPHYLADKLDARIGLLLDRKYLLVQVLGKGGMGVVLVALQQPLLREVALKLVSGVVIDDTVRGRFLREARAVAVLDHPNIVKLVDFGVADLDEDAPYMVMELVTGAESLRRVFARWGSERPTWRTVGEVFGQLLSALSAAHTQGLVHRDIKPDNVMAKRASGYDYFIKVLDFGLAKSLEHAANDGPTLTEAGGAVGTPQYMAPEQMSRAHFGVSDQRVDLYAVGAMLFEVVTGRRPYVETEAMAILMAKCDPDRDPLATADLGQFGPLETVLRRAMAWAAADRYASADALRADLLAAVQEIGPSVQLPIPEQAIDDGDLPTLATPVAPRTAAYVPTPLNGGRPPEVAEAQVAAESLVAPQLAADRGLAPAHLRRRTIGVIAATAIVVMAAVLVVWAANSAPPLPSQQPVQVQAVAPEPLLPGASAPVPAPQQLKPVFKTADAPPAASVITAAPVAPSPAVRAALVPNKPLPAKQAPLPAKVKNTGPRKPTAPAKPFGKF